MTLELPLLTGHSGQSKGARPRPPEAILCFSLPSPTQEVSLLPWLGLHSNGGWGGGGRGGNGVPSPRCLAVTLAPPSRFPAALQTPD